MTTAGQTPAEPSEFDALLAHALGQQHAGRFAEAEAAYCRILARWPDHPGIYNNLGVVLKNQGKFDQATARYQQAIALKPDFVEAHINLGNVLRDQGLLDQAAARHRQVIALRPNYAEAHNNLGITLWRQHKVDEAIACYRQSLALKPSLAEAHNNLANALAEQGQRHQALAHYQQAIAHCPDFVEAHNNLGNLLLGDGKLDSAVAHYEQALAVRPASPEAHYNLAGALQHRGQLDRALAHYEQVLALRPDYAEALNNLGNVLTEQGKFDEAMPRYRQAIALRPDYAEAHKNLGLALLEQLELPAARKAFERFAMLRPDSPEPQTCLATCYLIAEDFERGWPAYEARLRTPGHLPQISLPRWSGEPLAGRSLLLFAEQGLGDTFQFIRNARLLKQHGARVVLAAPAALGRLLAGHPDIDELFIRGSSTTFPPCDFYLPLLSAPGALGTTRSTIPCQVPYISADAELTDKWRQELAAIDGFKIAIAWQGARDYRLDRWRSIPLAQFAPLARLPGVRLISLQKGIGSEQIATVDFPVLDFSDRLDAAAGPFMDTAALIQSVDLVVTSDTAIAHLAGALGAPVWVALHYSPNWRWLLDRDDSPWYPTMRLFRQTAFNQWSAVFDRIAEAVQTRRAEPA